MSAITIVALLLSQTSLAIDTPGVGGTSSSGPATGGDAGHHRKRAYDAYTAGGNAYTGNSYSTDSGSVENTSDGGTLSNTGTSSTSITSNNKQFF